MCSEGFDVEVQETLYDLITTMLSDFDIDIRFFSEMVRAPRNWQKRIPTQQFQAIALDPQTKMKSKKVLYQVRDKLWKDPTAVLLGSAIETDNGNVNNIRI